MSFTWSIASSPEEASAFISDTAIENPTFSPEVCGSYEIQLIVNDGVEDSEADKCHYLVQ
ncbi:MAG: hypothetical protein ACLFR1_00730 [Spirochaetia bacterium]